jgi:hypothetical protein
MVHSRRVMVARGPAAGFQIAGEELDVGAAGAEQVLLVLLAPAVRIAADRVHRPWRVRPLYPARNPANASRSVLVKTVVTGTRAVDGIVVAIGDLRGLGLRPQC